MKVPKISFFYSMWNRFRFYIGFNWLQSINFTEGKYADLLGEYLGIASCIILYCVPKWIKNRKIGQLTGKVLVFGGVYSNLQAPQAIAQVAQKKVLT
jgi:hypothetical protein